MTANIYPGQKQLLIQPQVIEELDSNKTVVSTSTLSLLNYTVSTTVDASNNQQFTFSAPELPGGAQVFFVYCGSPTLTLPSQAVDPIFPFCCGPDFEQQRSIFRHQALGSEVRDGAIGMALRTAFRHLAPAPPPQRDPKCDLALAEQQHQQQHHHLHAPFIERDDDHNDPNDRIWYGGWRQYSGLLLSRPESKRSRPTGPGVGDPSLQLLLSIRPRLLGALAKPTTRGFFFDHRFATLVVIDCVDPHPGDSCDHCCPCGVPCVGTQTAHPVGHP